MVEQIKGSDAPRRVLIGLGASGLSCARYLLARGQAFTVVDSRREPPGLVDLHALAPDVEVRCGAIDADLLAAADELIVSPGIDLRLPAVAKARQRGIRLLGDIELFYRAAQAPIVAITGSNAKSTVTTLVGLMAAAAGRQVRTGGNLGTPALDLLDEAADLYVLELSSFQLDTVIEFRPQLAAFLNFCADHLDRYDNIEDYRDAKRRIYLGADSLVYNRDDPATWPLPGGNARQQSFTLDAPDRDDQFGLLRRDDQDWLAHGDRALLPVDALGLRGQHNQSNALAALAIGHGIGLDMAAMLRVLAEFRGLPHRCQLIAEIDGVRYVDDSKATNVGAAVASLRGLAGQGRTVLIAGGVAKEHDFAALRDELARVGRAAILIGQAQGLLRDSLQSSVPLHNAHSMVEAVELARSLAWQGDVVLLAPACASFDMFPNYAARGDAFSACVATLAGGRDDV